MFRLTFCYAAMLAAIVLLADVGQLQAFSAHLHQLPFGDKTCHFLLVGGLSFLVSATLSLRQPHRRLAVVAVSIVILSVMTSLEELSQSLLFHRQFEPADMACNIAGTFIFGFFALLLPLRQMVPAFCGENSG